MQFNNCQLSIRLTDESHDKNQGKVKDIGSTLVDTYLSDGNDGGVV